MPNRWLAGVLLFAFGFGSACLLRTVPANAGSDQGEVEPGLSYVNGPDFKLNNTGAKNYLVVVTRKPGMPSLEPLVSYASGSMAYSKKGLDNVRIYRVTPVGEFTIDFRPCDGGPMDCPLPRPLPPPPPPETTLSLVEHP